MPVRVQDPTTLSQQLESPGQPVGRRKNQRERFTLLWLQWNWKRSRKNSFSLPIARHSNNLLPRPRLTFCDGKSLEHRPVACEASGYLSAVSNFSTSNAAGRTDLEVYAPSVIAYIHRRADLCVIVKYFRAVG